MRVEREKGFDPTQRRNIGVDNNYEEKYVVTGKHETETDARSRTDADGLLTRK